MGPAEEGLCSGDIGAGSAFLREDGEDGAEPAVAMREMGAGASKEVNCVFMSRTRELVDLCTREGIEVEEEDGGEGEVGERANTGTEEKCSTGILILSQHREQTIWEHIWQRHPQLKIPNFVFIHRKHIFPFSTSSFRLLSSGKASSSARVRTDLIWVTSSKESSRV